MRRRGKSAREPRGVLLVPVLEDRENGEFGNGPTASASAPPPAVEDRDSAVPRIAVPISPPSVRSRRPRLVRVVGFLALIVALALAGLLFGRLLRSGTDEGAGPPATSAAKKRASAPAPRSEHWGPLTATPAGRLASPAARAAVAASGTRVVVLGGTKATAVQLGPAGGVLRPVASLPSARSSAVAFSRAGAVFLIGGERGIAAPTDQILRFDLASHRVTRAGHFIEPLAGAGYVQSGGSWLVAGGWTGETFATAVLRVSLPDTATLVARLPEALRDPAVARRGGKLYIAGGRGESGPTNVVYVVELASGTVSVLGRLPEAVTEASLVVAGGQLYLLGGRNAAGPVTTVVHIDPVTGKTEQAGTMPRPLVGAATVRAGGSTLVIGGTQPTTIFRLKPS